MLSPRACSLVWYDAALRAFVQHSCLQHQQQSSNTWGMSKWIPFFTFVLIKKKKMIMIMTYCFLQLCVTELCLIYFGLIYIALCWSCELNDICESAFMCIPCLYKMILIIRKLNHFWLGGSLEQLVTRRTRLHSESEASADNSGKRVDGSRTRTDVRDLKTPQNSPAPSTLASPIKSPHYPDPAKDDSHIMKCRFINMGIL